jgi:hypothetical protein
MRTPVDLYSFKMTSHTEQPNMSHPRETWALVLLTVGLFTGPIGLIAGWFLVATSTRWALVEKLAVAALPIPVAVLALTLGGGIGGYSCDQAGNGPEVCEPHSSAWIAWLLIGALAAAVLAAAIYLGRAARTRAA